MKLFICVSCPKCGQLVDLNAITGCPTCNQRILKELSEINKPKKRISIV